MAETSAVARTDSGPPPRVLAVVTHWNQPAYAADAVDSLLNQTKPADGIAVIDDASDTPPAPAAFDSDRVSLYRSAVNVGTFRLIDSAIRAFAFDWYLIQDCDDISAPTRLERLLHAALQAPADMVGSSIRNFGDGYGETIQSFDPEGGRAYLAGGANWFCPWGASLFRRALWEAVGGLASGLRLGGDTEFLHRAVYAGRIINLPSVELDRRRHPESLTLHPETGEGSEARGRERAAVLALSAERRRQHAAGAEIDLRPCHALPPVPLTWVSGPVLDRCQVEW